MKISAINEIDNFLECNETTFDYNHINILNLCPYGLLIKNKLKNNNELTNKEGNNNNQQNTKIMKIKTIYNKEFLNWWKWSFSLYQEQRKAIQMKKMIIELIFRDLFHWWFYIFILEFNLKINYFYQSVFISDNGKIIIFCLCGVLWCCSRTTKKKQTQNSNNIFLVIEVLCFLWKICLFSIFIHMVN